MAPLTTKAFPSPADKLSMSQEHALETMALLTAFFFLFCQLIPVQCTPHRSMILLYLGFNFLEWKDISLVLRSFSGTGVC